MACRRLARPTVEVVSLACRVHESSPADSAFPSTPATIGSSTMTATYGLLSTHPPTRCGLATFNAALAGRRRAVRGARGHAARHLGSRLRPCGAGRRGAGVSDAVLAARHDLELIPDPRRA